MTQNFDGNGPYLRAQIGGGNTMVRQDNPKGRFTVDRDIWVNTVEPPIGRQPQLAGKPAKKPAVRCYKNPVPDVNGPLGQVGDPSLTPVSP
jgi:hypothetical protein